MLEAEKDACVREYATEKFVVGFLTLVDESEHRILVFLDVPMALVRRDFDVGEDLLDDLFRRLVLEVANGPALGEKPQLRHDGDAVAFAGRGPIAGRRAECLDALDDTLDESRFVFARALDAEARRFAIGRRVEHLHGKPAHARDGVCVEIVDVLGPLEVEHAELARHERSRRELERVVRRTPVG
ncbi:hypothetical protein LVJ94_14420 [Pendulispora rubella]|uniref:Uncharacterized protein n=1 Tax=Pendulispora rubella TaxID=2741070 RepID=A0ABZ2LI11_9BACT